MSGGWRCRGVRWVAGRPVWAWEGGRTSPLTHGRELGFRVTGERRCPGARGNPCPTGAVVPARSTGGTCPECARLDRAHSVAADTALDDPRVFRVYLAWFGGALLKVGITAEERGDARLLEQGAVAFAWLGRGPLMAARRTEEVLGAALGVPDRIPYAAKRLARVDLPGPTARAERIERAYRDARAVGGWADTLEALPLDGVRDHVDVFGLRHVERVDGVVGRLAGGGELRGTVLAVAGPDLHLELDDGRQVVLDGRLAAGWELARAEGGTTLPVEVVQRGLF
ncbi:MULTISPECIES: DUF2797 domain-containing protein [Streptomyces]|uniref:DUF2797 domain-containing protein n=2 Tax=Streptomyces TaxID=1883 RepID=A0A124EBX7_9ACTN|nr:MULTISPECIES: DUF2797 domain-containing protein [Streptomyces]KUH35843.1 hypothetical protein ATE80_26875 [Streptomyces kanasensis]UUS32071.1 DUF2797 domain-containing protein [Streptomyces changanensis]